MDISGGFSSAARSILIAASVAIVVLAARSASDILGPVLLAAFLSIVAAPIVEAIRHRGVPKYLAIGLVLFILFDLGGVFAVITTGALEDLRESLPGYQQRLLALNESLGMWLDGLGFANSKDAINDLMNPATAARLVSALLANATGTFGTGLLVLLGVLFMLLEAASLRGKLFDAFQVSQETEERLTRVFQATNRYMVIKTLTSLATGACLFVWLWILGIDFAILWGLIAVLFNFVPFVGSVFMAIPAVLMALVQTDITTTLLVVLGYVVVNMVIGNMIEPQVMGRQVGMSALAVFLSLLFWGWILGTIGVFLSVPLTMALLVAFDANPRTRPIAILLGPDRHNEDRDEGRDEGRDGAAH